MVLCCVCKNSARFALSDAPAWIVHGRLDDALRRGPAVVQSCSVPRPRNFEPRARSLSLSLSFWVAVRVPRPRCARRCGACWASSHPRRCLRGFKNKLVCFFCVSRKEEITRGRGRRIGDARATAFFLPRKAGKRRGRAAPVVSTKPTPNEIYDDRGHSFGRGGFCTLT